jgi:hypothetical protein
VGRVVDEALVVERIAGIARALGARAAEFTVELVKLYEQQIPHLLQDDERMVSLLASSVQQNIETAMQVFQHDIDPARVDAPLAALEYARRLAQRGTPVHELIRAYHVGQTAVLDNALTVAMVEVEQPELLGAMVRRVVTTTFAVIDRVTQQVVIAYGEERDRWLRNQSALRAARVRRILASDNEAAELSDTDTTPLGYRLRGTHVGLVTWHAGAPETGSALAELETFTTALAAAVDGVDRPLFVPCDETSAWAWLPLGDAVTSADQLAARARDTAATGVRVALGEPATGVDGFRRTHRQALRVQSLSMTAGEHAEPVMTFGRVGAVALMASDLDSARGWVADTLGALAVDDEHNQRLRETLLAFLASGGSYTAAAAELRMHKNSVQYRVRKAEEAVGRALTANRLEVELALTLCRWLGAAVLSPV